MHRIIIPGPPGTGKTYRLMQHLANELNLIKTDPERIAYIAFSNAAADEAKKRTTNDTVRVSTMHSLGSQELGINTGTQLLKGDKWKSFKNFIYTKTTYLFKNFLIFNFFYFCKSMVVTNKGYTLT